MERNVKTAYIWISVYIILLSVLKILFALLFTYISFVIVLMALVSAVIISVIVWRHPLSDKLLYLQSFLNMIGGSALGVLVAFWLSDQVRLVSFLIPMAVIDLVSFTRFGKWTFNRKLMENNTVVKRLSVCLPVPGFSGLYPMTGIGDVFCFSLIVGATVKIWGIEAVWIAVVAILAGQVLNVIVMLTIKGRSWYRGIPATTLPVLFFVAATLTLL